MSKFNTIVIIGSTGLVGQELILLITKYFNYSEYNLELISNNHINEICKMTNIKYKSIDTINFDNPTIFINCANAEQAKYIQQNMKDHSVMIDNSSEFRMNSNVPLIIPEINWDHLNEYNLNIISNPNCSTIILAMLLNPFIKNNIKIKRIIISTYQSASGAGREGLEELIIQTNEIVNNKELTTTYWKQQYIFNAFVHNSQIENNLYCQEENKLITETNKIFKTNIKINPTCIRVPILRSHCESVNIEFYEPLTFDKIVELILNEYNTLELINNVEEHKFPTSLSSNNSHLVQVGHIRQDYSLDDNTGWNFWISGDQLLRGAAYNAFIILKKLII